MTRRIIVAEPPASYRVRQPMVVDCSVLAAALFDEPERDVATKRLSGAHLYAPYLLDFEIASVALKKARHGLAEVAALALADYHSLRLERVRVEPDVQVELVARYDLTTYDAAYLWLAAELKAPLATFDRRLGDAARRHLGALG